MCGRRRPCPELSHPCRTTLSPPNPRGQPGPHRLLSGSPTTPGPPRSGPNGQFVVLCLASLTSVMSSRFIPAVADVGLSLLPSGCGCPTLWTGLLCVSTIRQWTRGPLPPLGCFFEVLLSVLLVAHRAAEMPRPSGAPRLCHSKGTVLCSHEMVPFVLCELYLNQSTRSWKWGGGVARDRDADLGSSPSELRPRAAVKGAVTGWSMV